jgi:hypothetical protein
VYEHEKLALNSCKKEANDFECDVGGMIPPCRKLKIPFRGADHSRLPHATLSAILSLKTAPKVLFRLGVSQSTSGRDVFWTFKACRLASAAPHSLQTVSRCIAAVPRTLHAAKAAQITYPSLLIARRRRRMFQLFSFIKSHFASCQRARRYAECSHQHGPLGYATLWVRRVIIIRPHCKARIWLCQEANVQMW